MRRRRVARFGGAGSASAAAQAGFWAMDRSDEHAVAGRLAFAASSRAGADAAEDEFLWGTNATADRLDQISRDLWALGRGADIDTLATPSAVLWEWIDRARGWAAVARSARLPLGVSA